MDSNYAKVFLQSDALMRFNKKHPEHSCEKIDVYKYLINLCDKEIGTAPDDIIFKSDNGILVGHCTQCGHVVCSDEKYCCGCGERLLWE